MTEEVIPSGQIPEHMTGAVGSANEYAAKVKQEDDKNAAEQRIIKSVLSDVIENYKELVTDDKDDLKHNMLEAFYIRRPDNTDAYETSIWDVITKFINNLDNVRNSIVVINYKRLFKKPSNYDKFKSIDKNTEYSKIIELYFYNPTEYILLWDTITELKKNYKLYIISNSDELEHINEVLQTFCNPHTGNKEDTLYNLLGGKTHIYGCNNESNVLYGTKVNDGEYDKFSSNYDNIDSIYKDGETDIDNDTKHGIVSLEYIDHIHSHNPGKEIIFIDTFLEQCRFIYLKDNTDAITGYKNKQKSKVNVDWYNNFIKKFLESYKAKPIIFSNKAGYGIHTDIFLNILIQLIAPDESPLVKMVKEEAAAEKLRQKELHSSQAGTKNSRSRSQNTGSRSRSQTTGSRSRSQNKPPSGNSHSTSGNIISSPTQRTRMQRAYNRTLGRFGQTKFAQGTVKLSKGAWNLAKRSPKAAWHYTKQAPGVVAAGAKGAWNLTKKGYRELKRLPSALKYKYNTYKAQQRLKKYTPGNSYPKINTGPPKRTWKQRFINAISKTVGKGKGSNTRPDPSRLSRIEQSNETAASKLGMKKNNYNRMLRGEVVPTYSSYTGTTNPIVNPAANQTAHRSGHSNTKKSSWWQGSSIFSKGGERTKMKHIGSPSNFKHLTGSAASSFKTTQPIQSSSPSVNSSSIEAMSDTHGSNVSQKPNSGNSTTPHSTNNPNKPSQSISSESEEVIDILKQNTVEPDSRPRASSIPLASSTSGQKPSSARHSANNILGGKKPEILPQFTRPLGQTGRRSPTRQRRTPSPVPTSGAGQN